MFRQGRQLSSASSLTNLHSEPDYSVKRTLSASELFDTSYNYGSGGRWKGKQRAKDLRHSIADSRSDYYNSRRPQSICLSSQIPAHSNLQSASSISALGIISENEAVHGSSPTLLNDRDSIFADPPDTPIFHYTPTLALNGVDSSPQGPDHQHHTTISPKPSSQLPQGSRSHQLSPNPSVATGTPIHTSEPITQQFVPLYLNPLTGQMYSQNSDYYSPISNPNELGARPPKPDKRLEERLTVPTSYLKFTQFLAIFFLVCGNIFALVACSLPALFCASKVHQLNLQKEYREAKKHTEYVLCFNILGIALHIIIVIAVITTVVAAIVLLH